MVELYAQCVVTLNALDKEIESSACRGFWRVLCRVSVDDAPEDEIWATLTLR